MIDEKKTGLMTKLAIYERHEKRSNLILSRYYQSDFVRYNVLKTWIAVTIAYWVAIGSYIFVKFDEMLAKINDVDYFDVMYKLLGWYAGICVIYFAFSYIVYNIRYILAKPGLTQYNSDLKDLIELQGGPMHRAKVVTEKAMRRADVVSTGQQSSQGVKKSVNRSELLRKREEEAQRLRNEEILRNVQKRNERIANQNKEQLTRTARPRMQQGMATSQDAANSIRYNLRMEQEKKRMQEQINMFEQAQKDADIHNDYSVNPEGRK